MTDITDQDRSAYAWAQMAADNDADPGDAPWRIVARHYLATVDDPAPTLAEDLRDLATALDHGDPDGTAPERLRAAATRAEQIEEERDQARAEAEQEQGRADGWKEMARGGHSQICKLTAERDEARAEVERLTAERDTHTETHSHTDTHTETHSGTAVTDPADAKPGEAWLVKVHGSQAVGVRDGDSAFPWSVVFLDNGGDDVQDNEVTLLHRLVPALRVVTNPDELEQAKRRTVIRDADGVVSERAPLGDGWLVPGIKIDRTPYIEFPVTVLWEPEA